MKWLRYFLGGFLIMLSVMNCLSDDVYSESIPSYLDYDNYQKLTSFLSGTEIYDIGLFSSVDIAMDRMKYHYPEFKELCENVNTPNSLIFIINNEEDTYVKDLLITWYEHLNDDLIQISEDLKIIGGIMSNNLNNARYFTLRLPSGKPVNSAWRYIGSAGPVEYPNASKFSSARKVGSASWFYNCHSYAWYFSGNTAGISQSELLGIDDPGDFIKAPTCASRTFTTPRAGDLAVYHPCDNCRTGEPPSHSAIITSVDGNWNEYGKITVRSKWGPHGVYTHRLSDCPYYDFRCTNHCNFTTRISYYRIAHQYTVFEQFNHEYHIVRCYLCGGGSYKRQHTYRFSNGRYQCTICGYSTSVAPYSYELED